MVLLKSAWAQSNITNKYWKAFCINNGRIIASSAGYGIWYSDNNGETFTQSYYKNDTTWNALCITPNGRLLAAYLSNTHGTVENKGIWYTSGSGNGSWSSTSETENFWNALCIGNNNRIFAGGGTGIIYSDDDGDNWTPSLSGVIIQSLYKTSTGRLFAGSVNNGLYYSDDNGATWTLVTNTSGTWYAMCETSTGRLIAAAGDGSYYSDDNGATWPGAPDLQALNIRSLCVTADDKIIAGVYSADYGDGIWYSTDNGETFKKSIAPNYYYGALLVTPTNRIIAGSNSNKGILYADRIEQLIRGKFLDTAGLQEIHNQMMQYIQEVTA